MSGIDLESHREKKEEKPLDFTSGSIIFAQGRPSKYLYLLKKGEVRLIKNDNGKLSVIKNCTAPDILNEVSVLTKKPLEYSAICRSEVEIVLVDQKNIMSVLGAGPTWIPEILATLCERLASTEEMILEHNLLSTLDDKDLKLSKEEESRFLNALENFKSS